MAFLASDALNGRGSGTRDEWIAAAYLGSQMHGWGLEPLGDAGGFVQAGRDRTARDRAAADTVGRWRRLHTAGRCACSPLSAARVSGSLQKFRRPPVKPGACPARQLPARRRTSAPAGPVTTGAAIVLTREGPTRRSPSGARLPARRRVRRR